jgi:hypothetical protein
MQDDGDNDSEGPYLSSTRTIRSQDLIEIQRAKKLLISAEKVLQRASSEHDEIDAEHVRSLYIIQVCGVYVCAFFFLMCDVCLFRSVLSFPV